MIDLSENKVERVQEFLKTLLVAQGISAKNMSVFPFQRSGSLSVGNADNYFNFVDAANADYSAISHDCWFFGNLWLNPYLSSYTSGTSACSCYLLTHDKDFNAISFECDKRAGLVGVDPDFVSRLYFENVFLTGIRLVSNNANANYKVPYFFTGIKVVLR